MKKIIAWFFLLIIILYAFIPFGSAVHTNLLLKDSNDPTSKIIDQSSINRLVKNFMGEDFYYAKSAGAIKDHILDTLKYLKNEKISKNINSILDNEFDLNLGKMQKNMQELLSNSEVKESIDMVQNQISRGNLRKLPMMQTAPKYGTTSPDDNIRIFYIFLAILATVFWTGVVTYYKNFTRGDYFNNIGRKCQNFYHLLFLVEAAGLGVAISELIHHSLKMKHEGLHTVIGAGFGALPAVIITTCSVSMRRWRDIHGNDPDDSNNALEMTETEPTTPRISQVGNHRQHFEDDEFYDTHEIEFDSSP